MADIGVSIVRMLQLLTIPMIARLHSQLHQLYVCCRRVRENLKLWVRDGWIGYFAEGTLTAEDLQRRHYHVVKVLRSPATPNCFRPPLNNFPSPRPSPFPCRPYNCWGTLSRG